MATHLTFRARITHGQTILAGYSSRMGSQNQTRLSNPARTHGASKCVGGRPFAGHALSTYRKWKLRTYRKWKLKLDPAIVKLPGAVPPAPFITSSILRARAPSTGNPASTWRLLGLVLRAINHQLASGNGCGLHTSTQTAL